MTSRRKPAKLKGKARALRLKKETLKDLAAKRSAEGVKGGANATLSPLISCRCGSAPLRTCSGCYAI